MAGSWNYCALRLNSIAEGASGVTNQCTILIIHNPTKSISCSATPNCATSSNATSTNRSAASTSSTSRWRRRTNSWRPCSPGNRRRCCRSIAGSSRKCGRRGPSRSATTELHKILWDVVRKLYQKRIVLDFTDHLTDRELYCLIFRDILPAREKKIDWPNNYLHWDCTGANCDPEVWLQLLRHGRRARGLGRHVQPAAAAIAAAAVSAPSAVRAGVGSASRDDVPIARV